jgi:hypothetical protein
MAFKLKSGNRASFKQMGSSPARHAAKPHTPHNKVTDPDNIAKINRSIRNSKTNIKNWTDKGHESGDTEGAIAKEQKSINSLNKTLANIQDKSPAKQGVIWGPKGSERMMDVFGDETPTQKQRRKKSYRKRGESKFQADVRRGKEQRKYEKNLPKANAEFYKRRKLAEMRNAIEAGIKKRLDKKSPAKTHKPGHKEGIDYNKRKEELLNQGFTQKDADKMIESGAVTGKPDVESYKGRMERLSKKYKKTPEEINKILKSKDYTEGRTKIHSPNKHVTGTTHTHDDDLPEGYERGEKKDLKGGGTMTVIKKKEGKKEEKKAPEGSYYIDTGDGKKTLYTPPKKKKSKRSKVKRKRRPKARKVKNLVTGGYNIIR